MKPRHAGKKLFMAVYGAMLDEELQMPLTDKEVVQIAMRAVEAFSQRFGVQLTYSIKKHYAKDESVLVHSVLDREEN